MSHEYRDNDRRRSTSKAEVGLLALMDMTVVNVLFATLAVGMFVGYLALNNEAATRGFEIREVERRISELEEKGDRLDLKVVELKAMGNIESRIGELGLVPVSDVDYVGVGPSAVAVK